MQVNETKKVYIINNLKSSQIEQVILILKNDAKNCCERDLSAEAQEIINEYSKRINIKNINFCRKKKKKSLSFIKALPLLFFAALSFFIFKLFFFS